MIRTISIIQDGHWAGDGSLTDDGIIMVEEDQMRYTTWGSVRGGCGHVHRSARAAYRCLEQDRAGCHRQGGYSDRRIRVVEGGDAEMRAEIDRYHQDGPGRKLYLDDLDYEVIREMPALENEAAV